MARILKMASLPRSGLLEPVTAADRLKTASAEFAVRY